MSPSRIARRLALASLAAAPLAAQPTAGAPAPPAAARTPHQQLARAVYQELVETNTVDSVGSTTRAAEAMAARFRAAGFPAAYALNEGGGGVLQGGRPLLHSIQAAEKVPVNFTLTVTNPGGHSSVPRPDNAITGLAEALVRVGHYQFPVALNAVTRPYFARTAAVEPRADMAAAMRALGGSDSAGVAAAAATLSRDPRFASMLRTTCVATRLAGGHAYNALPQTATANVNCRIAPTSNADETKAALARAIGDTAVRITPTIAEDRERFGAAPSAVEPALLAAVTDLTRTLWGANVPVIPTMSTGATDGRFLRAAGVPTYGVSGLFSEPGETNAHGRDEKLRVTSFYQGLDFLDRLVRRLAGGATM